MEWAWQRELCCLLPGKMPPLLMPHLLFRFRSSLPRTDSSSWNRSPARNPEKASHRSRRGESHNEMTSPRPHLT